MPLQTDVHIGINHNSRDSRHIRLIVRFHTFPIYLFIIIFADNSIAIVNEPSIETADVNHQLEADDRISQYAVHRVERNRWHRM